MYMYMYIYIYYIIILYIPTASQDGLKNSLCDKDGLLAKPRWTTLDHAGT